MITHNSLDGVDGIVPWGGAVNVGGKTEGGMVNGTAVLVMVADNVPCLSPVVIIGHFQSAATSDNRRCGGAPLVVNVGQTALTFFVKRKPHDF